MRKWLVFFFYLLLELWVVVLVAEHLGAVQLVLAILAKVTLGALLLKRLGGESIARMATVLKMGHQIGMSMQVAALRLCAALLLLFPGLLAFCFAVPLLIPTVQKWIVQWLGRRGGIFLDVAPKPIKKSPHQHSAND